jgi:hypothetical protein
MKENEIDKIFHYGMTNKDFRFFFGQKIGEKDIGFNISLSKLSPVF